MRNEMRTYRYYRPFLKTSHSIAITLLLLCLAQQARTQGQLQARFVSHEGLEGLNAYSIYIDSSKTLWLGSASSIISYDGGDPTKMKTPDGRAMDVITTITPFKGKIVALNPKPTTRVYFIDPNHRISKEVEISSRSSEKMHLYSSGMDTALAFYSGGRLLSIDQYGELSKLTPDTLGWVELLEKVAENKLCLVGRKGAFIYDIEANQLESFLPSSISAKKINAVSGFQDTLYIACGTKLYKCKDRKLLDSIKLEGENADLILKLMFDDKRRLWIAGRRQGLFYYKNGRITDVVKEFRMPADLAIVSMYHSQDGNIWMSTDEHGLLRFKDMPYTVIGMHQGLEDNTIVDVRHYQDEIWISQNQGLFVYRDNRLRWIDTYNGFQERTVDELKMLPKEEQIRDLDINENGELLFASWQPVSGTPQNRLFYYRGRKSIISIGMSAIWYGVDEFAVSNYNQCQYWKLSQASQLKLKPAQAPYDRAKTDMLLDSRDRLWYGSTKGLKGYIDTHNDSLHAVPVDSFDKQLKLILGDWIEQIYEDPQGRVWFATGMGVAYIDLDGRYHSWFLGITKDGKGRIWCNGIVLDSRQRSWIASQRGLYSRGMKEDSFKVFGNAHGLRSTNIHAVDYDAHQNRLIIGSALEAYIMNPDSLFEKQANVPNTIFKSLEVIGDTLYPYPQKISLGSKQQNLRLSFVAPYHENQKLVSYSYSTSGPEGPWSTTANSQLELFSSSYGDHQINLRARIGNGPWSKPASLFFSIATPFWQRKSTQLTGVVLLFALLISVGAWRLRIIQQRARKEQSMLAQMKTLEQQALGAMMNPHFIYNSLNSIQEYFTRTKNWEASEHVAELGQLIRMNMDAASESFIKLSDELHRLRLYMKLEQQRFPSAFHFELELSSDIDPTQLSVPSMVIQPFLENAIWHGMLPKKTGGVIRLSLERQSHDTLKAVIQDEGVGLHYAHNKKPSKHISRGIQVTKERLELLTTKEKQGAPVIIEDRKSLNKEDTGVRVSVLLPIK